MHRKFSKTLSLLLKIALAIGVIYWMVESGKLNFHVVGHAFADQWPTALFLVATLYLQIAIISWRWNILNSALGFGISYREAFSLSMIGLLFTVIIPGSVGGDVIKAYYVGTRVPKRRAHAFTTILMDRYLGLLSLLTLGAAGVVWNYRIILTNKLMTTLATFVVLAFAGGVVGLFVAVVFSKQVTALLRRLVGRVPLAAHAVKSCEALEGFRAKPMVLVAGVLVTLPSHSGGMSGHAHRHGNGWGSRNAVGAFPADCATGSDFDRDSSNPRGCGDRSNGFLQFVPGSHARIRRRGVQCLHYLPDAAGRGVPERLCELSIPQTHRTDFPGPRGRSGRLAAWGRGRRGPKALRTNGKYSPRLSPLFPLKSAHATSLAPTPC